MKDVNREIKNESLVFIDNQEVKVTFVESYEERVIKEINNPTIKV